MPEYEQQVERVRSGELSREDFYSWIQDTFTGEERLRMLRRAADDVGLISTIERDFQPLPGGAAAQAGAQAGVRTGARMAELLGPIGGNAGATIRSVAPHAQGRVASGLNRLANVGGVLNSVFGGSGTGDLVETAKRRAAEEVISQLTAEFGPLPEDVMEQVALQIAGSSRELSVSEWLSELAPIMIEAGYQPALDRELESIRGAIAGDTTREDGGRGAIELPDGFDELSNSDQGMFVLAELFREYLMDPTNLMLGQSVAQMMVNVGDMRLLEEGSVRLQDGTLISQDMLEHADPAIRAQYQAIYQQRMREIEQSHIDVMNQYRTEQHALDIEAHLREQEAIRANYDAANTRFNNLLTLGIAEGDRVYKDQDLLLRGLSESRARSDQEMRDLMAAMPYGTTDGKTQFFASDLSAPVAAGAELLGLDPNRPILNYPGAITIDPRGSMGHYDQQLGIAGRQIEQLPGLGVGQGDVPMNPHFSPGPGSIQLLPPAGNPAIPGGGIAQSPGGPITIPQHILDAYARAAAGG